VLILLEVAGDSRLRLHLCTRPRSGWIPWYYDSCLQCQGLIRISALQATLQFLVAYHGNMNTVACLLSMEGVEINGRGLIDPPICRAVAHGHPDVVILLVQQGARLNINESTIANHDTALCIAPRGGDLEMVQALLRHQQIDANLSNRWFKDPLMLAVKGGHTSIVNVLVVDHRLTRFSLKRSLDLARNDDIWRVIRSRIKNENSQTLLVRSPRRRIDGL
jgi:hypothetical protein